MRSSASDGSVSRTLMSQPSSIRALVDELGGVDHFFVDLDHRATQGCVDIGDGLHRLDLGVGRPSCDVRAYLGEFDEHDVTECLLGVAGETEDRGITLDAGPVVLPVVLEVFRVHMRSFLATIGWPS